MLAIAAVSAALLSLASASSSSSSSSASVYLFKNSHQASSSPLQLTVDAPDAHAIVSSYLSIHEQEYLRDGLEIPEQAIIFGSSEDEQRRPPLLILADQLQSGSGLQDYVSSETLEHLTALKLDIKNAPTDSQTWKQLLATYSQRLQEKHDYTMATDGAEVNTHAVRMLVPGSLDGNMALNDVIGQDEAFAPYLSTLVALSTYEASQTLPSSGYLHLSGLQSISDKFGASSTELSQAQDMLRLYVESVLSNTDRPTVFFLAPVKKSIDIFRGHARVRRSVPVGLKAFSTLPRQLLDVNQDNNNRTSMPLVPTSGQCFASADDCSSNTNGCSGHGQCVAAFKAGTSGSAQGNQCWVCQCSVTQDENDNNRRRYWSGAACQKEDVSSQFFLIAGASFMILFIGVASVSLLAGVGSEPLPSTLAAIAGGAGGHAKRD